MPQTRRKFDEDFKEGAVRLVRETGKPIAQVARELGIHDGALGNWVNADRRRRERGAGTLSEDERAELVRLRKQCAELQMRCDVLKRSVALWVSEAMGPVAVAAFIAARREDHGIPHASVCRALGVSQSWFSSGGPVRCRRGQRAGKDSKLRSTGYSAVMRAPMGHPGLPRTCVMRAGRSARTPSRR